MTALDRYDSAVNAYVSELRSIGLSSSTISNYMKRLRLFRAFMVASGFREDPGAEHVRSWRDKLISDGASPATIRQYLVELKSFFEFASDPKLCSCQYYSTNPVSHKMYPRVKKQIYENVLLADDIKKLWANKNTGYNKLWPRNYAIVTLLLDGKIRNAELLDLKLSDIHFADEEDEFNYLVVRNGKGNKYREVDLTDISVTALKLYLKSGIRPENLSDDDYLFGTTAEKKFGGQSTGFTEWHRGSTSWLSKTVEQHVKNVTGKSGFRTHSMRHNGAIMELNTGTSMEQIQAELGHSSVQTTHIYAGRLQSKRNRMNMAAVYAVRDEWAEKNKRMLEGA